MNGIDNLCRKAATTTTPPDRILIEAARRSHTFYATASQLRRLYEKPYRYDNGRDFKAHCDTLMELDALGGIKWPVDRAEAAVKAVAKTYTPEDMPRPMDFALEVARLVLDEEWQP